jgi:penicillin-binding protein 2
MKRDPDRNRVFARRALLLGAAKLGLFGALAGRLHYLQVVNAHQYALLAEDNRINVRLLLPARGRVFDRAGRPLARNRPIYRVVLIPEQSPDIRATLARLSDVINVEPERIEAVLAEARRQRRFIPITVREDLTWTEVSRVAVHSHNLPGITLDAGLVRDYPLGEVTAHLLGYVGPVTEEELTGEPLLAMPEFRIGKAGIERVYDVPLRGRAGSARLEVNALGREIRELARQESEPGRDVELTIDLELQRFTFERLSGERSASAVVLDVHTGEVLALASAPSFEPAAFDRGIDRREWRRLLDDPTAPMLNKAIAGQYPPGSTFKMIVALAALESRAIGPDHEVYCPGFTQLGQARFHCWRHHGHGRLGLIQAIAQSCDVYFYDVARRAGLEAIADMARRFGFGERLGIDLTGERPGLVPSHGWKLARFGVPWQPGETLVVGIGQGYLLSTPLQLAVMTARMVNGGHAVRPWLARGVTIELDSTFLLTVSDLRSDRRVVVILSTSGEVRRMRAIDAALAFVDSHSGRQEAIAIHDLGNHEIVLSRWERR